MAIRTYTTMSSCRRALAKIGDKALMAAKTLVYIDEDEKFAFDEVAAEQIQYDEVVGNEDEVYTAQAEEEFHSVTEQEHAEPRDEVVVSTTVETTRKASTTQSETLKASMKLDRTITCTESEQFWKNAYQMWKAHPDWMTSAQQDRLTAQLYAAAKKGEKLVVEINGRHFYLCNV